VVPEGAAGEDVIMPKKYPSEFRDDVVAVARRREPGVTLAQIAADFGVWSQPRFPGHGVCVDHAAISARA
jgi:hypothetical protein